MYKCLINNNNNNYIRISYNIHLQIHYMNYNTHISQNYDPYG